MEAFLNTSVVTLICQVAEIVGRTEGLQTMRDWLLVFAPFALIICILVYTDQAVTLVGWVVKLLY